MGIFFLALLATAQPLRADGLIVIHDPPPPVPGHFSFAPLEVVYHRVSVEIKDQVAITSIDQEFYNPNNQRMEGTYLFPLPAGAHIDKFAMDVNGQMTPAELLDADKARAIYEEIVRKQRDPALLEYVGREVFKARIFPIEPHSRKQIKLQYTQLLKDDSGLVEYTYTLNTEKFSAAPLKDVSVKVSLACTEPIKSIYSPSHDVEIRREGDRNATVGYEARDVRPDSDFKLIFSRARDDVGINLLTYRNGLDKEGYFLLLASPGDVKKQAVQPKDICFVIDTSGSMAGAKLEQAKRALEFCLANLNESDRFEIVRFSTQAEPLFGSLQSVSRENLDKAGSFVRDLKPIGGTAIEDALSKAHALGRGRADSDERPFVVIFLTDGQPTVGEVNEDKLVALASHDARIFCFGIGSDVNTQLLDRIANQTKAISQYVLAEEDIEVKVSNFYGKIQSPMLTNVKLEFTKGRASEVYPNVMPDLFKGEMLIALGKFALDDDGGDRSLAVKITGTINGQPREFTREIDVATDDARNDFLPRLWATRRVGWLLDEIRLRGESPELKEEVVQLARRHGIVTPYTSYLIIEEEQRRNVPAAQRTLRELENDELARKEAQDWYDSARAGAAQEKAGDRAVANSVTVNSMKYAAQAAAPSAPQALAGRTQQTRVLQGKTFYQNGANWSDGEAQSRQNLQRQEIRFNSDEYFALLRRHPSANQWLSVGKEVDLVIDGVLYVIR